jgi:KDO2-lipid IV(A) lauroyltransferase
MPRQIRGLPARLQYFGLGAFAAPLKLLPLESAVRLGARLGGLAARVDRVNRKVGMQNLAIAFPESTERERIEILASSYRNWGRMIAEWLHLSELNAENIGQYAAYDGMEDWRGFARKHGAHGIIVLTAHFGNFELMAAAHALYGTPVAIVHRPLRNPLIDKAVVRARIAFGNHIIYRRRASREVIRLMHDGWMIAIALDLDVRRGVFVDFFSRKASTSDVVARLALATGAPVVPSFMVRENGSPRHKILILDPVPMVRREDREAAVRENTQRCAAVIEQMIRSHPDHWNWIHRRWKTRPPGERPVY